MIPWIDILIVLSGVHAAHAGPLRRYANTTSQVSSTMAGVAYQPYNGSPSLSLAPIEGITTLPFSQLLETPDGIPVVSSTTSSALDQASTTVATSAASFEYQPWGSGSTENAGMSSTTTHDSPDSEIPTSFWTFGDQQIGATGTVTSTTYTTVSAPPQAVESSYPQESTTSLARNTTTTFRQRSSRTFVFDPLPTSTDSPTTETAVTTTSSYTSATDYSPSSYAHHSDSSSTFAYPFPSSLDTTISTAASSLQSDDPESVIRPTPESSFKLPKVVTETEGASATQSQETAVTSNTTVIPGITIVPQNPSVIYITVTDAGATTTLTA